MHLGPHPMQDRLWIHPRLQSFVRGFQCVKESIRQKFQPFYSKSDYPRSKRAHVNRDRGCEWGRMNSLIAAILPR